MRWLMVVVAAAALAPLPAQPQFYDLDGAYHCLTDEKGACDKPAPEAHPAPSPLTAPPPAPPPPSLGEAIDRIRRNAPSPRDMALVEERAGAEDPRAVEVLAWCKLNGIGTKPDAVAAYLLYRDAARLGVANAKANETAIYESRLTSAERQQVLLKENAR